VNGNFGQEFQKKRRIVSRQTKKIEAKSAKGKVRAGTAKSQKSPLHVALPANVGRYKKGGDQTLRSGR